VLLNAPRQANQDQSQGCESSPLCDVSGGGNGCAEDALSGNPCPNPAVAFFGNACEAGMMCGRVEDRFLEWRATVAVCKNSRKTPFLTQVLRLFAVFLQHGMLKLPEHVEIEMKLRYMRL
jgi:hypothetical protein